MNVIASVQFQLEVFTGTFWPEKKILTDLWSFWDQLACARPRSAQLG